ncbi:hypothetical protein CsSME_00040999 [Camellia sinensis var. sinensis]
MLLALMFENTGKGIAFFDLSYAVVSAFVQKKLKGYEGVAHHSVDVVFKKHLLAWFSTMGVEMVQQCKDLCYRFKPRMCRG